MKLLHILFFLVFLLDIIYSFDNKSSDKDLLPPQLQTIASTQSANNLKEMSSPHSMKNSNVNLKLFPQKSIEIIPKIDMPSTQINSLSTEIFISKSKCSAVIKESAIFTLSNGLFSTITRRISLDGSADSISGFKVASG